VRVVRVRLFASAHFHELGSGVVEADVLPLTADARFALENLAALYACNLTGHRPADPLPQPRDMPLAMMHEIEPPSLATEIDPVTSSSH
jgi:hypothetical protein